MPSSGKTSVANFLMRTQNCSYVNSASIHTHDDEEKVKLLSAQLDEVRVGQRVVIEDFPENQQQAYLFSKN